MITNEELENIMKIWHQHITTIKEIDKPNTISYGNVNICIQRFRELADFLQQHVPMMREWMMNYLQEHRKEIFYTFWRNHIHTWLKGHIDRNQRHHLYPQAEQEWDHVFGSSYPFSLALQRTLDLQAIRSIDKCDDVVIRAIHQDIEHNGGWWGCDYCDEQEMAWNHELQRRMQHSLHPLLSTEWNGYQIKGLLLNWKDGDTWEPLHNWGWIHHQQPCTDLNEYKQYIKSRLIEFQSSNGLTPIQRIRPLLNYILSHKGWCIQNEYSNSPYHRFLQLWNTLDLVLYSIQLHLPILIDMEVDYVDWGRSKHQAPIKQ